MPNPTINPVEMPNRQGILWALSLILFVWQPLTFSVIGQWASSGLNVATSSLTAYATVQVVGNKDADTEIPLTSQIQHFLGEGKSGIVHSITLALALTALAGLIDTFVAWTLTWGHIRLLRRFTLAAIRSTLSCVAGTLDASTAIQRWLVKADVNQFLVGTLTQVAGLIGTVTISVWATFRTDSTAGAIATGGLGIWLILALLVAWKAVGSSRRAAVQHEQIGNTIRESARLRYDLGRPSLIRYWLRRSEGPVTQLRRAIGSEGMWGSILYGLLSSIGNTIPLAAFLVVAFTRDLGASIAVYLYLARLTGPLGSLASILPSVQFQLISIQRAHDGFAHLLRTPDVSVPQNHSRSPTAILSVSNLSVAPAPDAHHLRFPSFEAQEITCVVGDSGSGKSTLLRTLAGILPVSSGLVRYNGADVDLSSVSWRERCHLLPQEPQLIPMDLRDNLWDIPQWEETEAITKVLRRVGRRLTGNPDIRTLGVDSLSVGHRRAIAVCRCLGSDSPVLLLDEPFAGIDQELAHVLARSIEDDAARGRIIILALHRHDIVRTDLKTNQVLPLGLTVHV